MYIFLLLFFCKKISYIGFAFHSKNSKINYTVKYFKKKYKRPTKKFKKIHEFFLEFSNIQKALVQPDIKTKR
jgi:hypothetical protein